MSIKALNATQTKWRVHHFQHQPPSRSSFFVTAPLCPWGLTLVVGRTMKFVIEFRRRL